MSYEYSFTFYLNPTRRKLMSLLYDHGSLQVDELCESAHTTDAVVRDFVRRFTFFGVVSQGEDSGLKLTNKGKHYIEELRAATH